MITETRSIEIPIDEHPFSEGDTLYSWACRMVFDVLRHDRELASIKSVTARVMTTEATTLRGRKPVVFGRELATIDLETVVTP